MKKLRKWLKTVYLTSRWYKPMRLYHQHLIPYLPTKQLSMLWVNIIKTLKNWDTVKSKYPHQYSLEKLWAYALLVQAELTVRDKAPNSKYLETSRLGSNLCSPYFGNRVLYRTEINHGLKRDVIFLDHNETFLISSINRLVGKKLEPVNYNKDWIEWSNDYDCEKFKPVLCNGDYYNLLKPANKYTVGDKNFLR